MVKDRKIKRLGYRNDEFEYICKSCTVQMYKQTGSIELKSEFEFYLIPHAQLLIWKNSLAKSKIRIFIILDTLRSNYDEK